MKTTITEIIEVLKTSETKALVVESAFDKGLLLNKLDEKTKNCYKSKIFTYEYLKSLSHKGQVFSLIIDKEVVDKHKEELSKLLTLNIGWYPYKIVSMDFKLDFTFATLPMNRIATPNRINLTRKDIIDKIYYNEDKGTTVVLFKDGTKEKCTVMDGEVFDLEVGVLQCLIKKLYGSRSAWLKELNVDVKAIPCGEVKAKRTLSEFLNNEFAILCENQREAEKLCELLHSVGVAWISGKEANSRNTNWSIYKEKTCYNLCGKTNPYDDKYLLQFSDIDFYKDNKIQIVKMKDIVGDLK